MSNQKTPLAPIIAPVFLLLFVTVAGAQTKPSPRSGTNTTQGSTGVTQGGVRPSAATSPNTANLQRNSTKGKATGDEDLEDLEVERRTVQGIEKPGSGTVQPRPSAGTSPNVARQVPSPAAAPGPRPYGK